MQKIPWRMLAAFFQICYYSWVINHHKKLGSPKSTKWSRTERKFSQATEVADRKDRLSKCCRAWRLGGSYCALLGAPRQNLWCWPSNMGYKVELNLILSDFTRISIDCLVFRGCFHTLLFHLSNDEPEWSWMAILFIQLILMYHDVSGWKQPSEKNKGCIGQRCEKDTW